MSTRAFASAVINAPVETVWAAVREFTFPSRLANVESCTMDDGAATTQVGAVRSIKWTTGEERQDRLLEISDQYRRVTWEVVSANHPTEVMSQISTVELHRITEGNATYISWASDFSADATGEFVSFQQAAFAANLADIRAALSK